MDIWWQPRMSLFRHTIARSREERGSTVTACDSPMVPAAFSAMACAAMHLHSPPNTTLLVGCLLREKFKRSTSESKFVDRYWGKASHGKGRGVGVGGHRWQWKGEWQRRLGFAPWRQRRLGGDRVGLGFLGWYHVDRYWGEASHGKGRGVPVFI
jgi:hypothetical protein